MNETEKYGRNENEKSLDQIRLNVQTQDYREAITSAIEKLQEVTVDNIPFEQASAVWEDSLAEYLRNHPKEAFAEKLGKTRTYLLVAASLVELLVNTLGLGRPAATVIHNAANEAAKYPPPFDHWLLSSVPYLHMMWYPALENDKLQAMRNFYRLRFYMRGDADFQYRCEEVRSCDNWETFRYEHISGLLHETSEWRQFTENFFSQNPCVKGAYDCAVYDSILTQLETGTLGKRNETVRMRSLFYYASIVPTVMKNIPHDCMGSEDLTALYDMLLKPITGHLLFLPSDYFPPSFPSPLTALLKGLDEIPNAKNTRCHQLLCSAQNAHSVESLHRELAQIHDVTETVTENKAQIGIMTKSRLREKRIFLSSSFRDMHAERDYLLTHTFSQLDLVLRLYGVRLCVVDLRGTSQECESEAYNRETFRNCLDEVDRCRPTMIGLIGERYGWVPYTDNDDPVMNAVVEETADQHGLLPADILHKSMTHLEMLYGIRVMDLKRCYFYFRDIRLTNGATTADLIKNGFIEPGADTGYESSDSMKQMILDKYGVRSIAPAEEYGNHTQYYTADYDGKSITNLTGLGDNIFRVMAADISNELQRLPGQAVWFRRMQNFWDEAAYHTVIHPRLQELLSAKQERIFLTGPEGIGKTVLLAQLWEVLSEDSIVIPIEVLLDPDGKTWKEILNLVPKTELYLRQKFTDEHPNQTPKKVVVLIDGVEMLVQRGYYLEFGDDLAEKLPENVQWILCGNEKYVKPPKGFYKIALDSPPAAPEVLIRNAAFRQGKRLDKDILPLLCQAAEKGNGNPLFIDFIIRRLLNMLQQDFETGNHIEWMKKVISETDGSIASVTERWIDRAEKAMGEKGCIIREIQDIILSAAQSSAEQTMIKQTLTEKGLFGEKPKQGLLCKGAQRKFDDRAEKILRDCYGLLKPVLVFDCTVQTWTFAHSSYIKRYKEVNKT